MSSSTARRWALRGLVVLVLIILAVFAIAPAKFKEVRHPLLETPADFDIKFEEVAFPASDQPITIRGWWMPAENAHAALVFVHGGGANRSLHLPNGLAFARDMIAKGYDVLDIDLRNHGTSDSAPDGRVTFGTEESYDVIGALNEIEKRAPGLEVGVVGWSMGGNTVIYAAAQDQRIKAVVADDTFAWFSDILPGYMRIMAGVPGILIPPMAWSAQHLHDVPLDLGRAENVIGQVAPRPVLLVRNEGDPLVPPDHIDRLAAGYPGAQVWRVPAPKADDPMYQETFKDWAAHVCSYRQDPTAYLARVGGFLDQSFPLPAPVEAPVQNPTALSPAAP